MCSTADLLVIIRVVHSTVLFDVICFKLNRWRCPLLPLLWSIESQSGIFWWGSQHVMTRSHLIVSKFVSLESFHLSISSIPLLHNCALLPMLMPSRVSNCYCTWIRGGTVPLTLFLESHPGCINVWRYSIRSNLNHILLRQQKRIVILCYMIK